MNKYRIYPKQFRNAKIPIEKHNCFVLMPFESNYDLIYGEIKKYLQDNGFICNRADELSGSLPIMGNILNEILKAHFVIADLTGQNPNVFYELGIAHSFKDAGNIILISQNTSDIPFDIRHLNTIIYKETNLKHLTASILKTINENKHYYYFFEALQKKAIIATIHDDKALFLDYLQDNLNLSIESITDLINGDKVSFEENEIKCIHDKCIGILYLAAEEGKHQYLKNVMDIIGAILANCGKYKYTLEIVNHLLHENKLENYSVSKNEIISLQSSLSISLASQKVCFNEAMQWIIEFFKKSKSASIDLNRYSLESFLMTSQDVEVDEIIVNSVFNDNCYVREHMADIIGDKKIDFGLSALIKQLSKEENIYTSSSIITALGKLKNDLAFGPIQQWYLNNRERILKTQHYFILKHIYYALKRIEENNDFIKKFYDEFAEHLTPAAIF